MVNVAIILLPLCSQVFTCVHMASVNDTDASLRGNAIVAKLRVSGSDYWTEWYDVDDPVTGTGDYETLNSITSKLGRNICPNTHRITKAECRIDDGDFVSNDSTDVLSRKCSTEGVICLNRDQPSGRCHNYNIRFYCDLKEDDETDESGNQSRPPRFDMRIYIILAAVPVAIFILRICWSCTFERRRRRLRRARRALRRARDSVSIDPEVFMPPPSYQELFGDGEVPFSLSRHYSLCRKCKSSECEIFRNRQNRNSESQNSQTSQSESSENSVEVNNTDQSSSGESSTEQSRDNESSSAVQSTTNNSSASSTPSEPYHLASTNESQSSSTGNSHNSSGNVEPQLSSQTVEASQCDCPCHKRALQVMAYDNPAYAPEVEIQEGRSTRLPGMHLSVFSLFRSPSNSSLTEPPPPSYREALKILKKTQKGKP